MILFAGAISGLAACGSHSAADGTGLFPVSVIGATGVAIVIAAFWGQVVVGLVGALEAAGYRCDGNFAVGVLLGNLVRLGAFAVSVPACSWGRVRGRGPVRFW